MHLFQEKIAANEGFSENNKNPASRSKDRHGENV